MSFEIIENLSSEELALLYDDVIEGAVNIAQCACGTDSICSYNGNRNYDNVYFPNSVGACIINNTNNNYFDSTQCREVCKTTCQTDISFWWAYRQTYCSPDGRREHNPCTISSGGSYSSICR